MALRHGVTRATLRDVVHVAASLRASTSRVAAFFTYSAAIVRADGDAASQCILGLACAFVASPLKPSFFCSSDCKRATITACSVEHAMASCHAVPATRKELLRLLVVCVDVYSCMATGS